MTRPTVRFLHTGDWQLGMTRRFLSPESQARFSDDRLAAVAAALATAREQDCAFVVVAGDVFETNQIARATVARTLDLLRTAPCPVYLLPGNHDPLDAASVFHGKAFRDHPTVTVLRTTEPVRVPGVPAEVVGAPWTSKRPVRDLLAAALAPLAPAGDVVRVAVGHGATDTLSPNRDDPTLVVVADAERALADGRVGYVALGDRHSLTDVGGTGRIRYAGAPEATDFDEVAPGHVLVVTCGDDACVAAPHRTGRWTFAERSADLLSDADLDLLGTTLDAFPAKDRTIVKLVLRGTLTLKQRARLDALLDSRRDLFAAVTLSEGRTELVTRADDGDLADVPLAGFARAAADDLRVRSAADPAAADALALLLRLLGSDR